MTKKVILTLGCLVLLTLFTSAAMANVITITFTFSKNGSLTATNGGILVTNLLTLQSVEDDNGNGPNTVAGNGHVQTGAGTITGFPTGPLLTAFGAGPAGGVFVNSTLYGNLLTGDFADDTGKFFLTGSKTGTASGTYDPSSWDQPDLGFLLMGSSSYLAGYGLVPFSGGWTVHTTNNSSNGIDTLNGNISSAQISFQVQSVPEPGTLALLGTGILGLAGAARRKLL